MNVAYLIAASLLTGGREPKLSVTGDVDKRRTYTSAELKREFADEVKDVPFKLKSENGHSHAFPLLSLIKTAGLKIDPKRKNGPLACALVVTASDGYTVTFSVAELTQRDVWVALDWNDQTLEQDDAPARLIVPNDEKPSRWVHGVRTLRVVNFAKK